MIGIPAVELASAVQTVHTSGINWESVAAIVGVVVAVMTSVFGFIAKYISSKITGAINIFRIEVVGQLDTRLTKVEDKLDTLNTNNPKRRNGR